MSLEEAFLRDICANPDEDAPRLIYADWLDEQGEPAGVARAGFIRAQIALAIPQTEEREKKALVGRQDALLKKWRATWTKPFRKMFARCEFRRGFIEQVTIHADTFLEHGPNLITRLPLRHVKLRDPS